MGATDGQRHHPCNAGVLFDRIGRIFDDHDLLITPSLAVVVFPGKQRFLTEIVGETRTTDID